MYYDVQTAKIHKSIYRPSSNVIRFVKSLIAVVVLGDSYQHRFNGKKKVPLII